MEEKTKGKKGLESSVTLAAQVNKKVPAWTTTKQNSQTLPKLRKHQKNGSMYYVL